MKDSVTVVPKPIYDEDASKKLVEALRKANFDDKFNEILNSIISQIENNSNLDESVSYISHSIINSTLSNEEKGLFFEELVDAVSHITENT